MWSRVSALPFSETRFLVLKFPWLTIGQAYICTALCSNMHAETHIHSQLRDLALPLASSTPHLLANFQTKHSFIITTRKALKLTSTLLGRKRNKNGRMTLKLKTRRGFLSQGVCVYVCAHFCVCLCFLSFPLECNSKKKEIFIRIMVGT